MSSRYELLTKLSSTLYGEIYLANDKLENNQVAVKLSSLPKRTNCLEDPLCEVSILEKLREAKGQNYIVRLIEAFPVNFDGTSYLCTVMELASGGDMLDKILTMDDRKKKMSFRRIKKYLTMMANGVSFLHNNGISHLDLSLENMLLTSDDEIRICDFGQAQEKRFFEAFSPRRGKLGYMCPEVYKFHSYDGFKADVWSLGVIFWSMLANGSLYDKPVSSDPHFAYVAKGKEGLKILFAGSGVRDVPSSALDLLANMLSINSSSRYTIEQVVHHPWLQDFKSKQRTQTKKECIDPRRLCYESGKMVSSNSLSPSNSFADVTSVETIFSRLRHMSSDTSHSSGSGSSTPEQAIVSNPLARSQTGLAPKSQKKRAVKSQSAIFSLPLVQNFSGTQGLVMKGVMKGIP